MLKLSRMELSGFKSFYQRTQLVFPDGITAVVGPNGCGKSNISDAISWVLGEQSSKSLRGSKMEDVIFNGSAKRGPLPMAEVTLTLMWQGGPEGATNGNGHRHPDPGPVAGGTGDPAAADDERQSGAAAGDEPPDERTGAAAGGPVTDGGNGVPARETAADGGNGHHPAAAPDAGLDAASSNDADEVAVVAPADGESAPDASLDAVSSNDADGESAPDAAPSRGADGNGGGPPVGSEMGDGNGSEPSPLFRIPTQDGATISVTRRLFRNGDSEYRIDERRCRLRDVQDVLRAACIGARTYAVIEQGRVHTLIAARPKERKELIDEAAGILGYKSRRRSALLKLESTEANLSRLRDLIAEVKRQVNSLKRQASKARRFQRNAEEIRRRRRVLFHFDHRNMTDKLTALGGERDDRARKVAGAEAARARDEAAVESMRQRIDEEGRGAGERRDLLHERQRQHDRVEGAIGSLAERAAEARSQADERRAESVELHERSRRSADEAEETRGRREDAVRDLATAERELARLEQRYTGLLAAADEASRHAEEDRNRLLAAVALVGEARNRTARLQEAGERLARQRTRLASEKAENESTLEAIRHELEASGRVVEDALDALRAAETDLGDASARAEGAETALERIREDLAARRRELHVQEERAAALSALWQPESDRPEPRPESGPTAGAGVEAQVGWEAAAGTGLGHLLRAHVVDDLDSALAALQAARERNAGPIRIVCRELIRTRPPVGGDARLSSRLTGAGASLVAAAAGDPLLAEDLRGAVDLWRRQPGRAVVCRTGEGVSVNGVLIGGGESGEAEGLLACNRQRREAEEAADRIRADLPAIEAAERDAREALDGARTRLKAARDRRETAAQQELEARLHRDRHAEEQARAARRRQVIIDEETALVEEHARTVQELEEAAAALVIAEDERGAAERAGDVSQSRLASLRQRNEGLSHERGEQRSTCAARREALRALEAAADRLRADAEELEVAARRRHEESRALVERAERQDRERRDLVSRKAELIAEIDTLSERCRADEMSLQESRAALGQLEKSARASRQAVEAARELLQSKEVELARAASDFDHLVKECDEQFGCTPEALGKEIDDEDRERPIEDVRAEIARLEQIRERIGPVNMMAIEQFAEVEERETYLVGQQEDLEESIRSLNATIQKINETSRERFLHALEHIRREFNRIFTELFGGGHADIVLEDEEDVLESGIDVIAQPPGKRNQSITLLSGGEKALSAIALLFAIFNYRPSPFCLLDEVDAPLDEANVDRFARLLRDYGKETQFILITHNRRSMEIANAMYGVTMGEPGVSQTVSMQLDA